MRKLNEYDYVEILGTDGIIGWISKHSPTNTDMWLVALYEEDVEAVYPYKGRTRLYPEYMLTKCLP